MTPIAGAFGRAPDLPHSMPLLLHLLFFVSGATALVYQVAWVRSLTLVFGGSHLAVTTVLAVFMGGLALGGFLLGRRADRAARPLRLYGLLELGIAGFALLFLGLTTWFPTIYGPLARIAEENPAWLTLVRVALATLAMIGPTTLMGGTLPVLVRFLTQEPDRLGRFLSRLYAINTLGAVVGTAMAGFLLLQHLGAFATQVLAIGTNVAVGLVALAMPQRSFQGGERSPAADRQPAATAAVADSEPSAPVRLALSSAFAAGFCALGYEVLWTRMLAMVVGTSVYGFTIILVAFLVGIALGSGLYGLTNRRWHWRGARAWIALGALQVAIGLAALAVTFGMRNLTQVAPNLQGWFAGGSSEFAARQWASLLVALAYMTLPATLLGAAFPMAGVLVGRHQERARGTGSAVGSVLLWNTVGAVLGAALTGFLFAPGLGYERSLHLLTAVNVGAGVLILGCLRPRPAVRIAAAAAALALPIATCLAPGAMRLWDPRDFATYMNNTRWAFADAEVARATQANFEVLYFHEGANESISVLKRNDGLQTFVVNGRPEASTGLGDMQVQYALGHLPALLHRQPETAFVLGTGAGMTLGAVSVHPSIRRIVLAEIEPFVLPATRLFGEWNHRVLDDPKVHVVFNDGRNHLATTEERFDVITADPIHPWSGGAAYLYTREYFRSMRARLKPGGVVSQWLPLYELSIDDVKMVARTFDEQFEHVAVFVSWYDAVLVASDQPLDLDEQRLGPRMEHAPVAEDLDRIGMKTPRNLLAYFVLGDAGVARYAGEGPVNTDDNLLLEFSAPLSMGVFDLMGKNVVELGNYREQLLDYLPPAPDDAGRQRQARWTRDLHEAGKVYDVAHAHGVWDLWQSEPFQKALVTLLARYPTYAPYKFLKRF
ncbi:MAG: spermidine synthase [Planctomycetes bacterium]|nr:spermidine synthase [Planctomycetota bacterium]